MLKSDQNGIEMVRIVNNGVNEGMLKSDQNGIEIKLEQQAHTVVQKS